MMNSSSFSTYFDIDAEVIQTRLMGDAAWEEISLFHPLFRARALSHQLIDDKGDLDVDLLDRLCLSLERQGFIFYPTCPDPFRDHALRSLKALRTPTVWNLLKQFRSPLCHKKAEQFVLSSLGASLSDQVTTPLVRKGVLCAFLTPLRQSVGSCFATAPAILIQREQPVLFFKDMYQLLSTGILRRVVGGVEYAMPLSPSTGLGSLRKPLSSGAAAALDSALSACGVMEKISYSRENTAEAVIEAVLLRKWDLTPQETADYALQQRRARDAYRMGMGLPIRKMQQLDAFKADEERAQDTFKAYSDNLLLKAWEFTLASFSEAKMTFSTWNFYYSLGFSPEEEGGIGSVILQEVQHQLDTLNAIILDYQRDYERAFDEARAAETLVRNASSESMARRLNAEYQSRAYHMRACLGLRDEAHARGSHLTTVLPDLLRIYTQQFPEYFQEIYDATMQEVRLDLYEDSAAGFRLVYKQGRRDPSSWTLIQEPEQYIEALADFFALVQPVVIASFDWKGAEEVFSALTTQLILHVRTETFLQTAFKRMARAHGSSLPAEGLTNLSLIDKKPWAYSSGGTMTTLLKTYYGRSQDFTTEERWVESAEELLIFILDTLKELPPKVTDVYLKDKNKRMLMTSPTHAFSLLPGRIYEGWQGNEFTYTWVRDRIIAPARDFYASIALSPLEQRFLYAEFCKRYSLSLKMTFYHTVSIPEWRSLIADLFPSSHAVDLLDSFLVASLPLTPLSLWKERARILFPEEESSLKEPTESFLTRESWLQLMPEGRCLKEDLHHTLQERLKQAGLMPCPPFVFADTNWGPYAFGFVFNPGTERLELWRTASCKGVPMSTWAPWLSAGNRKTWILFTHPSEYA